MQLRGRSRILVLTQALALVLVLVVSVSPTAAASNGTAPAQPSPTPGKHVAAPAPVTRVGPPLPVADLPPLPAPSAVPPSAAQVAAAASPHSSITPTDPVAMAVAQAKASGTRVEVTAKDTQTDTTWANPNGTLTTDVSAGPVRVRQGAGFVPVDPTLVARGSVVVPKATTGNVQLSGGGRAALASLGSPGARLGLGWASSLPTPTLAGDTATYHDVAPGADLVAKALTTGYEVSLVLRSRPAVAPVIRLPLALDGLHLAQDPGGRLALSDATGKQVAGSPAPMMTSAARGAQSDEPTQAQVIPTTVEQASAGPTLVLRPDPAFLADPATVYPVTIDPAGTLGANLSNYVASDYPNQNYDGDSQLKVGTYNGGATVDRSFVHFDDSSIKGLQVTSATLNLYEVWSWSCNPAPMYVEGAGNMLPGTTWNHQPPFSTVYGNASFYGGYSGCPSTAGWKSIAITGLGQHYATDGYPSPEALAMVAPNESDSSQWKRFNSVNTTTAPYISFNYNNPATAPSAPTNAKATAGNRLANVTWSPSASNGGAGIDSYYVNAFDATNNAFVAQVHVCGTCTSASVGGLANGHPYYFGVYAHNAVGFSAPDVTSTITPDVVPGVPQGAIATPGSGIASIVWAPPVPNGGTAVTQYAVLAYYTNNTYSGHDVVVCATCYTATVSGSPTGPSTTCTPAPAMPAVMGHAPSRAPSPPTPTCPGRQPVRRPSSRGAGPSGCCGTRRHRVGHHPWTPMRSTPTIWPPATSAPRPCHVPVGPRCSLPSPALLLGTITSSPSTPTTPPALGPPPSPAYPAPTRPLRGRLPTWWPPPATRL